MNKIKKIINASLLCIKYPFLYPRNRFTGHHYDNWKLLNYQRENYTKAYHFGGREEGYKISCINYWWAFKLKIANFLNRFIAIFNCIPTYTELDSMPEGWRKAFGIKMCDEIKQELKKHKGALRNYRITDIKEKFGGLRWYDFGSPEKVWKEIIPKYTELSYKTCIDCGKPAEYISVGWISPYCNNCIKNNWKYVKITEDDAWDKALRGDLSFLNKEE